MVLEMFVNVSDIFFLRKGVGDAFVQCSLVRLGIWDDGIRLLSSSALGFLEVGFYGVGQVHMDNDAHVRFVYAHAESIGCHHDTARRIASGAGGCLGGIVQVRHGRNRL